MEVYKCLLYVSSWLILCPGELCYHEQVGKFFLSSYFSQQKICKAIQSIYVFWVWNICSKKKDTLETNAKACAGRLPHTLISSDMFLFFPLGSKTADPCCYGHTQFHLIPDRLKRERLIRQNQAEQVEAVFRANAIASLFAWTGAQAMYQGKPNVVAVFTLESITCWDWNY